MIPAYWYSLLPSFLWQVVLHSSVMGIVFYVWARGIQLPSGRPKRQLLGALLILPLLTAAIPGRASLEFREEFAWLDSGRILGVPLVAGIKIYHMVLLVVVMMVWLTFWQELLPVLRRSKVAHSNVPEWLTRRARDLPGWSHCQVVVRPSESIGLATGGWPWKPRLFVSRGALDRLTQEELNVAMRHENAHWQAQRWIRSHVLFVVRLLQCYNPVALWSFREYCIEVEIECDADAVSGCDPGLLARTLLKIYESTDRRDLSTRSVLRKRVDVLLKRGAIDDNALPVATIVVATSILVLLLPWLV